MFRPLRISGIVAGIVLSSLLATISGTVSYADPAGAPAQTTPAAPDASATPPISATPTETAPPSAGKQPPAQAAPPAAPVMPKTSPFPDVPVKHPAAPAVASVKNKNIMGGRPDGKFHGAEYVTRYELAVILDRFVKFNETEHKPIRQTRLPGPFNVSAPVGHWAHNAQIDLVQDQFLPTSSPLLQKPGTAKVTKQELTEALAETMIRLSDRSLPPTDDDSTAAPAPPQKPAN